MFMIIYLYLTNTTLLKAKRVKFDFCRFHGEKYDHEHTKRSVNEIIRHECVYVCIYRNKFHNQTKAKSCD